jgi:spore coat polysaccharide biosynthesis protein SpsF
VKVVAIIQARMGSTRLPGKVLRQLAGKSVLAHVIGRVSEVRAIERTVVATTTADIDDAVAREAQLRGTSVYRGSETDVLDRYYRAAIEQSAATIVRITSDCPLLDPVVVSAMLHAFDRAAASGDPFDYISNGLRRTFPRGLDAEIFTMAALARAHRAARAPYEREHVTPYIYEHPNEFRIHSYESSVDLSRHRWTLDTEEDYAMLSRVFGALASQGQSLTTEAVLRYLGEHPDVVRLNASVKQKALGQ